MRTTRAALVVLVLGSVSIIDLRPSAAEIHRPWCAQYTGFASGRTCAFTSYEQCMMTATPGSGAFCIQNPWYLQYGEGGQGTTGRRERVRNR